MALRDETRPARPRAHSRRRRAGRWAGTLLAFAAGFLAGAVLVWRFELAPPAALRPGPAEVLTPAGRTVGDDAFAELGDEGALGEPLPEFGTGSEEVRPAAPPERGEVERAVGGNDPVDPLAILADRRLSVPVRGVSRRELRDSFAETRGSDRRHEAIDILAPRGTPVVAVEDGTVAKLFESELGGLTIYQIGPDEQFAYYYAHLDRYARGLDEGQRIRRGQVIGYVGTSGNAPESTPHLHFAVYRLTPEKRWWEGEPLNPFDVLR